jgi:hypothetical protein
VPAAAAAAAAGPKPPKRRLATAVLAALQSMLQKLRQRRPKAPAGKVAASADRAELQQQEDEPQGAEQQPLMVLEVYDTLMLPTQEDAAAARKQWVAAVKVVAATHMLSATAGLALRYAPALLGQLQQPAAMVSWLARAAAQPGDHAAELLVASGVLLALLSAVDGIASAVVTPGGAASAGRRGLGETAGSSSAAALLRRVVAVEFSAAAAACAAAACLNWALSYVVCLVLVPLAIGCAPGSLVGSDASNNGSSSSSSSSKRSSVVRACLVLLCCSPVSVLLLLAALSNGVIAAAALPQWLAGCVVGSSLGAYTAFWAVYLPCWVLSAWSVWVHARC